MSGGGPDSTRGPSRITGSAGIRRFEQQGLRWQDVDLVESVLRVVDSKTEEGVRSIALSPALAEELWQRRRATNYQGEDERVFCNQKTGGEYDEEHFASAFRAALTEPGSPTTFAPSTIVAT